MNIYSKDITYFPKIKLNIFEDLTLPNIMDIIISNYIYMDDVRNARKRRMKRFHKQIEYYGWYWTDGTQREYYYQSADNTGLIDSECAKVIDLMVTDDTKLPQKVDGKSIGGVCSTGEDCHSGDCASNRCVKGSFGFNAKCIHNDQCLSSKCVAGKCAAATTSTQSFSNYSGNLDTYDKTKPIDTLILVFVILMILFLLFRICKRLKVMK